MKNSDKFCPSCGADLRSGAVHADDQDDVIDLGPSAEKETHGQYQYQRQTGYNSSGYDHDIHYNYDNLPYGIDPSWPVRDKTAAGLLGIFLGDIGVHQFYLGHTGKGILMLVFCWTGIPGIVGLIQGIIYLCESDHDFMIKEHVRTR